MNTPSCETWRLSIEVSGEAGQAHVTVSPGFDVGPTSKVFVTLQSFGGPFERMIKNETANSFVFWLTANATQPVSAAWLVVN